MSNAKPSASTPVKVNITSENLKRLQTLAELQGITITDALNRAIEMEHFLKKAQAEGKKILTESANGDVHRVVMVR